jgi:hypothetical protein
MVVVPPEPINTNCANSRFITSSPRTLFLIYTINKYNVSMVLVGSKLPVTFGAPSLFVGSRSNGSSKENGHKKSFVIIQPDLLIKMVFSTPSPLNKSRIFFNCLALYPVFPCRLPIQKSVLKGSGIYGSFPRYLQSKTR